MENTGNGMSASEVTAAGQAKTVTTRTDSAAAPVRRGLFARIRDRFANRHANSEVKEPQKPPAMEIGRLLSKVQQTSSVEENRASLRETMRRNALRKAAEQAGNAPLQAKAVDITPDAVTLDPAIAPIPETSPHFAAEITNNQNDSPQESIHITSHSPFETLKAYKWDIAAVGLGLASRAVAMRLGIPPETIGMAIRSISTTGIIATALAGVIEMSSSMQLSSMPLGATQERVSQKYQNTIRGIRNIAEKAALFGMGAAIESMGEVGVGHMVDMLGHGNTMPEQQSAVVAGSNITDPSNGHREHEAGFNYTPTSVHPPQAHPIDQPLASPGHAGFEPGVTDQSSPNHVSLETLASNVSTTATEHSIGPDAIPAPAPPEQPNGHPQVLHKVTD